MTNPEDAEDRYVHGTYSLQSVIQLHDVGTLSRVEQTCDFMIDTQTQQIVQVGDDGLDISQVEAVKQMLNIDPAEFWPHLSQDSQDGTTP